MSAAAGAGQRWPDFLVIGAPKAGTTALYKALSRHPRIFASAEKEPRFFAYMGVQPVFLGPYDRPLQTSILWNESDYLDLFASCPPGRLAGEASTAYLHDAAAPVNAREKIPGARLIAVLRQPVDRAYSQFLHFRQEGVEKIGDFEAAWNAGAERRAQGWAPTWLYRERGYYAQQLERWLVCFPPEQLLVLFYEDWLERPAEVLGRICRHLGIEDFDRAAVSRENVSSRQPRWKWLNQRMVEHNALRRWAQRRLPLWARDAITRPLRYINMRPGPALDPRLRARLTRVYLDDIQKLETMTGRNLDHWKCTACA